MIEQLLLWKSWRGGGKGGVGGEGGVLSPVEVIEKLDSRRLSRLQTFSFRAPHLHNAKLIAELNTCCICSCIGGQLGTPSRILTDPGKHALLAPIQARHSGVSALQGWRERCRAGGARVRSPTRAIEAPLLR